MVVPELEHMRVAHTVTIVSEMMHNFRVGPGGWEVVGLVAGRGSGGVIALLGMWLEVRAV